MIVKTKMFMPRPLRLTKPTLPQVNGLVKTVFERFGRLHVLVNNAGVAVTGLLGDPSKSIAQYRPTIRDQSSRYNE